MNTRRTLCLVALIAAASLAGATNGNSTPVGRAQTRMNFDWKFSPGDPADAQRPEFDDASWRTIHLPHDWSIFGPSDQKAPQGQANGFRSRGIGWYRKTFVSPDSAGRVFIDFEGVYTDAEVWLNGTRLGKNHNGYLGFRYDITGVLKPAGATNVLAVRASNARLGSSRWYTGGGINRDVHLIQTADAYIPQFGTWITTPAINPDRATVHVETVVTNSGATHREITLTTEILDPSGNLSVATVSKQTVSPGDAFTFQQNLEVPAPRRWSIEEPNLYRAISRVAANQSPCDTVETTFGFRTVEFSPRQGLLLNGKKVDVKGFNIHHDLGCLGAAAFARGYERRFELMKATGCNAVRLAHNPYPPVVLDLCDRMGLLVFAEAYDKWTDQFTGPERPFEKAWPEDLRAFILRDRHHPSVFIWSVGNEVNPHQTTPPDFGVNQYTAMAAMVKRIDPTRAVTCGLFPARGGGVRYNVKPKSLFENSGPPDMAFAMDVVSYNYMQGFFERDHREHPDFVLVVSEIGTNGSGEQWFDYDHSHTVGQFYWGGFDYIGESFGWPCKGWFRGLIDLAGFRKPASYYVQSFYSDQPMARLAVQNPQPGSNVVWNDAKLNWEYLDEHWNWTEGTSLTVFTFSNAETVELFLNGRSLGVKKMAEAPKMKMRWQVPFARGELKVIARKGGHPVAEHCLQTAGRAARLVLESDRPALQADGLDLAHITAKVVDDQGRLVPDAAHTLRFAVTGTGTNAGVDNGDMYSDELWQAHERSVYHGRALLVVRADRKPGRIQVRADADGLKPAELEIPVHREITGAANGGREAACPPPSPTGISLSNRTTAGESS